MMRSSNGNIFRVTGHLCGEFTCPRWIPRTKASDAELWWVFFICVWINGWVNNREAGDLRRHHAHYEVTVLHWYLWDVPTRPCPNYKGGLTKPPLKLGHEWVVVSQCFTLMGWLIHALISRMVKLIYVNTRGPKSWHPVPVQVIIF